MSLIEHLKGTGPSGFGYGSTAEQVTQGLDLSGRTLLVTGANSGLGTETVRVLALRGARVYAAARSEEKARAACQGIVGETIPVACELAEPASVRACVARVQEDPAPLDAIVCNAGIMALPELRQAFGIELQFFTNHIGHFMLVTGLLEKLSDEGRVVMLSSSAHRSAPKVGVELDNLSGERGYRGWKAYGQSKFANLLFAKELARRLAGSRRTANAVHPGVILTKLTRSMTPFARIGLAIVEPIGLKSVEQGAATQVYAATHPTLASVSGEYFVDCNIAEHRRLANNAELAARLWAESERIVAGLP
jgi:WW domain-containing oxidoreductase